LDVSLSFFGPVVIGILKYFPCINTCNIFVVVGGQLIQQSVEIPIGTYCAPLLANLFLYSYEAEFIQKFLYEKKKYLGVAINSSFQYIDDILPINNNQFQILHIPLCVVKGN
jgi:hypothetical protein